MPFCFFFESRFLLWFVELLLEFGALVCASGGEFGPFGLFGSVFGFGG